MRSAEALRFIGIRRCFMSIGVSLLLVAATSASAKTNSVRQALQELGDCTIDGNEPRALELMVQTIPGTEYVERNRIFIDKLQKCLDRFPDPNLRFSPRLIDFVMADSLARHFYRDLDPGDLARVKAGLAAKGISMYQLDVSEENKDLVHSLDSYRVNLSEENARFSSECVIRRNSKAVRNLLLSSADSDEEKNDFKALTKDLSACWSADFSSSELKIHLRGWLAITYVKLAHANAPKLAPAGATK